LLPTTRHPHLFPSGGHREKAYVPVVRDNRLNLAEVTLGFDDGRTVEVTSGIAPDDLVALNVGQAVRDGETVQPVPAGDD